jgi:hypothetical protein
MAEELGKIERPDVEKFKTGRKLYFVPLILTVGETDVELDLRVGKYWDQVESQLANLEEKLGEVACIFHEMVPVAGEEGKKTVASLSKDTLKIAESRMEKGARLEALEDTELLFEYMDWSRCLSIGLQSKPVFDSVYESYNNAGRAQGTVSQGFAGNLRDTTGTGRT